MPLRSSRKEAKQRQPKAAKPVGWTHEAKCSALWIRICAESNAVKSSAIMFPETGGLASCYDEPTSDMLDQLFHPRKTLRHSSDQWVRVAWILLVLLVAVIILTPITQMVWIDDNFLQTHEDTEYTLWVGLTFASLSLLVLKQMTSLVQKITDYFYDSTIPFIGIGEALERSVLFDPVLFFERNFAGSGDIISHAPPLLI